MNRTTGSIFDFGIGRGVAACGRALSRALESAVAEGLALGGYPPAPTREKIDPNELLMRRRLSEAAAIQAERTRLARVLEHTKAEYDQYAAGARKELPVLNILIISGGGDWGAFGAGFLKGWQDIPGSTLSQCRSSIS